jgi:hypothetical protein
MSMQAKKRVTYDGKNLHPKTYFTAQDLEVGKEYNLIIRQVVKGEEMFNPQSNKKETKPVIYFNGMKTGTVLGIEFSETIATVLGEWESSKWNGCKVTIFRTVVRKRKDGDTEGIRAKKSKTSSESEIPHIGDDDSVQYTGVDSEINWETATFNNLVAWAAEHNIDDKSVNSFLQESGGSIPDAHARMEKALAK